MIYTPLALFKVFYFAVFKKYDVLHLQLSERLSFFRKSIILALGKFLGMHVIVHHHGAELIPFYLSSSSVYKKITRYVVNSADINIVLGKVWKDFLVDEIGIDSKKVCIKANSAKDVLLNKTVQRTSPWHFLVLANLSPRKGIGELLDAISMLRKHGFPAKLTLAGGGEISHYKRICRNLKIDEYCTFTGWINSEAAYELLLNSSALVLPSYNEGLPMTIIEALSAKLPIVTTAVGSIPEFLLDEVHCLFVTPGSPEEIFNSLKRIAEDSDLRKLLTDNGRNLYESKFDTESYMQDMLDIYLSLRKK